MKQDGGTNIPTVARSRGLGILALTRPWGLRPRNYEAGSPGVVWKLDNIQL